MRIIYLLFSFTLFLFSQAITENLEYQKVSSVSYAWKHVNFSNNYSDAIVVCSNVLPSKNHNEAVVRINNITASGFDVKIQRPNDVDAGYTTDVYCVISDEGSYFIPFKYEAHKVLSTNTSGNSNPNNWSASRTENISSSIVNSYTKPAVMGQVMSYNDSDFSVFWSFDCENRRNRPFNDGMADGICVGKHVGQIAEERMSETLGFIVAESGVYELEDFSMAVNYGNSIKGVGNSPAYSFTLDKAYTHGIVTKEAENGGQGGWSVLYGASPFGSSLDLAIDEETIAGDTTRGHIGEDVAYWVFLQDSIDLAEMKINEVLYQETVGNVDEFIEFYVTKSANIKNYLFTDQDGTSHHYRFPKHTVSLGDYVILHVGAGTNSVNGKEHHFYMGKGSVFLNNTGDDIVLLKPSNDDITIVDGKIISAIPFDYISYDANADPVPTSAKGMTLSWNSSEISRLENAVKGRSISLTRNGQDSDTSLCWELTAISDVSKKATNCTNYISTTDSNVNANQINSLGSSNTFSPDIKLNKTSVTIYDPINLTNNPKAIPSAVIKYLIEFTNEGLGSTDSNSLVLTDSIPQNMQVCVTTVTNCEVTTLIDGTTSSGLTLGSVEYSTDNASTFTYTPVADAEGYDSAVTDVRFLLNGSFSASDGSNHPSATIQFFMGVE